ncbi:MAG: ABC transporter permease [Planctomycetota bacterium]|jgi:ABC-2 type transport system permease protein
MGEAAAVAAGSDGARLKRAAVEFGTAVGAGAAGGIAGTLVSWLPAFILLLAGSDYASVGSAVARVLVAGAFIAAGIVLARLDRLPLVVGLGAVAGAAVGALFGPRAMEGFGSFVGAFGPGILWGVIAGVVGFALAFTQIPPLMRRELNAFFCSPIVYVVGTVFLFFFGLFYFLSIASPRGGEASLSWSMGMLTFMILPIIAPVLTMRLLAEEKRSGTIEVLMTAPVRDWEVVVAKFLAALTAFVMMLVPTLVHVFALYLVSERGPASAPLIGGYLGMSLTAALFLSLGILASALSRDQIVAAIVGFAFSFCVFLMSVLEHLAREYQWFSENESMRKLLENISYARHSESFTQGLIDSRGLIYFLSLIVFVLFLTVRAVESRKWR